MRRNTLERGATASLRSAMRTFLYSSRLRIKGAVRIDSLIAMGITRSPKGGWVIALNH